MPLIIKAATTLSIILLLTQININSLAAQTNSDKTQKTTILIDNKTPLQKVLEDTTATNYYPTDTTFLPGRFNLRTTPAQDSAYVRALRLKIPISTRFANDLKAFSKDWQLEKRILEENPWNMALSNLDLPAEFFMPSAQEKAMYQYNILESQNVPFVRTINPFGLKIPMSAIGSLLGLTEDLSPVLVYSIDFTTNVEVVIYSVQAKVVATIFKGNQNPGKYRYVWNGRDDLGMKMPSGDYIAEIRIGDSKFIRKRIYIN